MFGFGKKKETSNLPKQLQDFLTAADENYMRAFAMKSIKVLSTHFTRECSVKIARIVYSEGNYRFFGTDKFRTTRWSIERQDSSTITLLKVVDFDKVKVSKSFKMQVADNYSERWCVSIPDYKVMDVVGIS